MIKKSKDLANLNSLDSSDYYVELALEELNQEDNPYLFMQARLTQLTNLVTLRKYEEAEKMKGEIVRFLENNFAEPNNFSAELKFQSGKIYDRQRALTEAVPLFKASLDEFSQLSDKESKIRTGDVNNALGINFARRSFFSLASDHLEEALAIYEQNLDSAESLLYEATIRNNLGNLYLLQNKDERSLEQYLISVNLKKLLYNDENHLALGKAYYNIGNLYIEVYQYYQAQKYIEQSIRIKKLHSGEAYYGLGEDYLTLGKIFSYINKDSLAESYLLRGEQLIERDYKEDFLQLGVAKFQIAFYYSQQKNYNKAREYYELARSNFEKHFDVNSTYLASTLGQLGLISFLEEDYEEAESYMLKSLGLFRKIHGERHRDLSEVYLYLTRLHFKQSDLDQALEYSNNAIDSNVEWDRNGPIDLYKAQNKAQLLSTISIQGSIHKEKFLKSQNSDDLHKALISFRLFDSLVNDLPQSERYNDNLGLLDEINMAYDHAVETEYLLYSTTKDLKFLDEAVYFADRGRNALLAQRLEQLEVGKYGNIPSDLISYEGDIQEDISYLRSEIFNKSKQAEQSVIDDELNLYRDRLFQAERALDSFIVKYREVYPSYFQLKYDHTGTSLKQIKEALTEDQILLDYVVTDQNIYLLSISRDNQNFFKVGDVQHFNLVSENFSHLLTQPGAGDLSEFLNSSNEMFQFLMGPLETLAKELIIVPDETLNFIPFEIMTKGGSGLKAGNFEEPDYLIKHHAISYAYSTSLQNEKFTDRNRDDRLNILAMASSFTNNKTSTEDDSIRSGLRPLNWTLNEVEGIMSYYNGEVFLNKDATEKNFRNSMTGKDVLHIASHGIIEPDNSLFSRILFEPDNNDTINDGSLFVHELYNLNLTAKMVVLSACQTGTGKVSRGEGTISLARGFAYAGVPSVVMSHWPVDDKSTSILMKKFYGHLSNGLTKSEALRKAKLDYLKEAGVNRQHPFFWAAFVVVGDDSPIVDRSNRMLWWYLSGGLLVLLLLGVVYRRKSSS